MTRPTSPHRCARRIRSLVRIVVLGLCGSACGGGSASRSDGTVRAWRGSATDAAALPPLPVPRANHCSVATPAGRLYVFGGNYKPAGAADFVALDDAQVADQRADGTLSVWRQAGSLPSAITGCTAASDDEHVYLVGGLFENQAQRGHVWAALVMADGGLGVWDDLGALPEGHTIVSSQAFVREGTLFVFDSTISQDATTPSGIVLLRAALGPPLGTWTIDRGPEGFRGRPQYATAGDHVFVLGGYLGGELGNEVVGEGFGAPFDARTGMGASFSVAPLPASRAFGAGVGIDDWVFVLGGKTAILNAAGQADVFSAPVKEDGTLGAFSTVAQMPEGRTNMDAVVLGDYLYVTGGGTTGGGLDNVFAARVRF